MHRFPSRAIFVLALAALAGCGSGRDATDRRLHKLQDELTRLQNTADRLEDRVAALELRGDAPARSEAAPDAAALIYRPRLKVIHMAPGDPHAPNGDKPGSEAQER